MKNKAFTIRFNCEVEAERKLLDMLEKDSKNYRSSADCIKSRLIDYYDNHQGNDSFEEIIKQSHEELISQMYDICLKIISAVGSITVNATATVGTKESILPEATDSFPDGLSDVLDNFVS